MRTEYVSRLMTAGSPHRCDHNRPASKYKLKSLCELKQDRHFTHTDRFCCDVEVNTDPVPPQGGLSIFIPPSFDVVVFFFSILKYETALIIQGCLQRFSMWTVLEPAALS